MSQEKDLYFVAVKVFLEDTQGRFLIIKDRFGDWDLPGGRLREIDFEAPFEEIVERKMKEELGDNLKYELSSQINFMRHEREEILPSGEKEKKRIFAIGYRAQYYQGNISLGKNHEMCEWVTRDFIPEDYFTGGWLVGVKDYLQKIGVENNSNQ